MGIMGLFLNRGDAGFISATESPASATERTLKLSSGHEFGCLKTWTSGFRVWGFGRVDDINPALPMKYTHKSHSLRSFRYC